jgi:chromate transporter
MDINGKKSKILFDLFITFFKIGAFTVGGGLAMLPIIEKEIVDKKRYLDKEEIIDAFAVSQSLPGIISINSAIYVGYRTEGFIGAVVSALGVILPSFITILVIAVLFPAVSGNIYVNKALTGVKAGVAAVIASSLIRLGRKVIKDTFAVVIAIAAFLAAAVFDVGIVIIILAGGLSGYIFYTLRRIKHDTP